MAYTVNSIYTTALSLCDYYDDNGLFLSSPIIKALKAKTPYLCDIAQRDLIYGQGISTISKMDLSVLSSISTTNDGYKLYKLPSDCINVMKIIEGNPGEKPPYIYLDYLFVDSNFSKTLTLIYKSTPPAITNFTDTFSLNDNIVMSCIPYYLAANFLAEENPIKSALYIGFYEKAKQNILSLKEPDEQVSIYNDY